MDRKQINITAIILFQTEYDYGDFILFVSVIIKSILLPISVIGNVTTVLIYCTHGLRRHSMSFYFCAMGIINIVYACIQSAYVFQISIRRPAPTTVLCRFYFATISALQNISASLLMFATIDRLRFIVYPSRFLFVQRKSFQTASLTVICLVFFSANVPYGLNHKAKLGVCQIVNYTTNSVYTWINLATFSIGPSVVMFLSSYMLVVAMRKSRKTIKNTRLVSKKTKFVVNILSMNMMFFLTSFLNCFMQVFYNLLLSYYREFYWLHWGKIYLVAGVFELINFFFHFTCQIFVHLYTNKIFFEIFMCYFRKICRTTKDLKSFSEI
jgi:hypothetical protein